MGLELSDFAKSIYEKTDGNITLLTGVQRLARGDISPSAPTAHHIDRIHAAIALAAGEDVNVAINWCRMQGFADNPAFKGALEAYLRLMKPSDPDLRPARTLWTEVYQEPLPEPEGVQPEMELEAGARL